MLYAGKSVSSVAVCFCGWAVRSDKGMHLQGPDEEYADQVQALRQARVQLPERWDGDDEDDQVGQETGGADGVTGRVLVDAVAVWNRLVPEVGEGRAREHDRHEFGQEPGDYAKSGHDQNDENLAGGEDAAVEAQN